MALSRYYEPTGYKYMSQFVPKNLEIMDKGLQRAQAKQDKQISKLDELNSKILKQKALPEFDTKVRDQIVEEVKSFSDEMANTDLTNPENFRKVNQFVQSMVNDERINKINMGLASKAKYDKIKEDLLTKKDAYAPENDRIFMQEYEKYLTQPDGGGKFAIDFIGGKELIEHNAPSKPELEKIVDNMKASGYTYDKERGVWKDRHSNTELSYEDLMDVLKADMYNFKDISAGRQMARRAKDKGITYEEQFLSEINPIAMERAYKTSSDTFTSNVSHLLGKKKLDAQDENLVTQPLTTNLVTHGVTSLIEYDQKVNTLKNSTNPQDVKSAYYMEGNRDKMLNVLMASGEISKNEMATIKMNYKTIENSPELIKKMYTASFPVDILDGDKSTDYFKQELQKLETKKPGYLDNLSKVVVAESLGLNYGNIEKKIDNAIAKGVGTQKEEILLPNSRQADKKDLGKTLYTLLDNINYDNSDVKSDDNEVFDLKEVSKIANPNSISMVRENGRIGISFSTIPKGDIPSQNFEIYPKQLTSAFDNFLKSYATNKEDYAVLREEMNSINYQPVGRESNYNQMEDMGFDKQEEKEIGSWNIQYPQGVNVQKGVILNNLKEGVLTNEKFLKILDQFSITNSDKKAIASELGINTETINSRLDKEVIFKSPALARKFLAEMADEIKFQKSQLEQ